MKTKIKLLIVFSIFCIVNNLLPQKTMAQNASVNFQVFYDELSPYGTWIENPEYGYVWIPDVDPGFAPYATNGYWVYTENGWTWVSGYSWGWATFHYGRWYSDPYYGPMWIPDNEWGPGWVSWRSSSDYYGWAPMGPGISISLAYGNGYYEHFNNYTFVRGSHFGRRDINNYYINNSNNTTIINNTTVINNTRVDAHRNTTYSMGPNRTEVEKRGGKKITAVPIKESTKPGERLSNNQLQIYRPQIKKTTAAEQKPAPARVANLKDVKSTEQRIKENPTQKSNPADKQLQRKNQDVKQQPAQQQQRNIQPAKQQPDQQQQRNIQPAKQQPAQQQQRNVQPAKQQPAQPQQRNVQPVKQQPAQPQQRNVQPVKQQPAQQQQRNVQPAKQQPSQQHQRNVQQAQPQPQPQPHQQPQQRNSQQAQPQENKNEPRHSN